ncbi:MAG: cyclopropane-fatty-acyl-phospholipid synthase family protein [Candidatus Protistobacter heckmanni]|nr:cyclopropane-fatty-acyl-phospholipid synthase family protein [Candidatus Protistobacter heckmanni]
MLLQGLLGRSMEGRLDGWIDTIRQRLDLPVKLVLWDGRELRLGLQQPRVTIKLRDKSALPLLLFPSLINLGEAYIQQKIDIEGSLTDIIQIAYSLASQVSATGKMGRVVRSFRHSKTSDKAAIQYHYDVSNEFYKRWLDDKMVYSCAYYETGDEDLSTAQTKKIDHILTKIQLRRSETLLDIGCGWGALAIRAAQQFGAKCVGITLSQNQYDLTRERVAQAGLQDQVEIRMQDYRDVTGQFDRITSVGMFEHVGHDNLTPYFAIIAKLLKPDGLAMNHGITSTDPDDGDSPLGGGAFIDKYVFPQGELPHISTVLSTMQEGGLEAFDVENLRRHYARTCGVWAQNFEANAAKALELAGEQRFRIWRIYLAACSHAFDIDHVALYQVVCGHAGRSASKLPWSRRYIYGG